MDTADLQIPALRRRVATVAVVAAAALVALYPVSRWNYLLFHTFIESFTALVAVGIFVIAWNARRFADETYLSVLGSGLLWVGLVAMLHAFAYKGMGVFPGNDPDLPTQLWIVSRMLLATTFLLAAASFRWAIPPRAALVGMGAITIASLASIWVWHVFPVMYVEGVGLTPLKVALEYVVIALLGLALLIAWREHRRFAADVSQILIAAIAFCILAEVMFTQYAGVYDAANFLGHYFALLSFGLVYMALVDTALTRPIGLLFRDLQERAEGERRIAETLQAALLTMPEKVASIESGTAYMSATSGAKVGGDFYDLFSPAPNLVAFVIGDMCGKGVAAAAATAMVRTTVRGFAYHEPSPADVLWRANEAVSRQLPEDRFATVLYGVVDLETGLAEIASAGHPAPLICSGAKTECLDVPTNPPLGVVTGIDFATVELKLETDDLLVLFTDGLLDAGYSVEPFGEERVAHVVAFAEGDTSEIAAKLLDAAILHADGHLADDAAVVALRLTGRDDEVA